MATNETQTAAVHTLDHAALIYRHAKRYRDAVNEARRLLYEARVLRMATDLDTRGLASRYLRTMRMARSWRSEAYAAWLTLSHFTRQAVQEDAQSGYVARVRAEAAVDHAVSLSAVNIYACERGTVHVCAGRDVCSTWQQARFYSTCPGTMDSADWIIEVTYNVRGHRAVYGVLNGVVSLWMN